jgi:hypothetical protein
MPKRAGRLFHAPARVIAALLLPIFAACFCLAGRADLKHKPWIEKDWRQWSSWDVDNTLHYSPWVSFDEGVGRETGPINFNPGDNVYSRTTWIQLTSALPIRQANLRAQMLSHHYDRMNDKKKQEFDQQHANDLVDGDSGRVRLYIFNSWPRPLPDIFRNPNHILGAAPARQVALRLSNDAIVMPTKIDRLGGLIDDPLGNMTEYTFPRTVAGKSILNTDESALEFVFGGKFPKSKIVLPLTPEEFRAGEYAGGFSFSIASLMYIGKPEY